jgi:ribonuclease HI
MTINIYTDGACSHNKGAIWAGGWAALLHINSEPNFHILAGKKKHTTNNEMELVAFNKALNYVKTFATESTIINIYTDSAYITNCFKELWYVNWRKNNWLNAKKKPIKHKKLWQEIIENVEYLTINSILHIQKVAAHSTNEFNNYVDNIAVFMKEQTEITNENLLLPVLNRCMGKIKEHTILTIIEETL